MESGIYIIRNKNNNHFYVGISKNIQLRWRYGMDINGKI